MEGTTMMRKIIAMLLCLVFLSLTVTVLSASNDSPSSWAADHVNAAIEAKLVPQALQTNYTQAITRAEYCSIAVTLYETVTEKEIADRKAFDDTNDINVEKAAAIGLVSGIGNNMFAPDDKLTREQ